MQFRSHAVFYLKKALKRYGVKMLLRGWLFSQKRLSPWKSFSFFYSADGHQTLAVTRAHSLRREGGKVTWCVEFKLWQDPKYFTLWYADIPKLTTHRKSSRSNLGRIYSNLFLLHWQGTVVIYREFIVNLTSTSAPKPLSTVKRKYSKYIRPMMIPVAPGRGKKKKKKK